MTQTPTLPNASSLPTQLSEFIWVQDSASPVETSTEPLPPAVVISLDDHRELAEAPSEYTALADFVANLESNVERRQLLERARRWSEQELYQEESDTIRTLRLRKGWSQARLAEEIGTSQSHVARIERGTENIYIETCRRLCRALDIDMNTLDQALQRQELAATSR